MKSVRQSFVQPKMFSAFTGKRGGGIGKFKSNAFGNRQESRHKNRKATRCDRRIITIRYIFRHGRLAIHGPENQQKQRFVYIFFNII